MALLMFPLISLTSYILASSMSTGAKTVYFAVLAILIVLFLIF